MQMAQNLQQQKSQPNNQDNCFYDISLSDENDMEQQHKKDYMFEADTAEISIDLDQENI